MPHNKFDELVGKVVGLEYSFADYKVEVSGKPDEMLFVMQFLTYSHCHADKADSCFNNS